MDKQRKDFDKYSTPTNAYRQYLKESRGYNKALSDIISYYQEQIKALKNL